MTMLAVAAIVAAGREPADPAERLPEAGSGFRLGGAEGAGERPRPAPDTAAERAAADRRSGSNHLPMSLERAAAQLLLVGFDGTAPRSPFFARLRARGWGAVALSRDNFVDDAQVTALAGEVGAVADLTGHPRPLVVATPDLAVGRSARTLRAWGVGALLGPPLDLPVAGGPWEGRAIGHDEASVVAVAGGALRRALTGGVAPVPGHFPGEGGASQDPEAGAATVGLSREDLRAADMRPFAAIARTAPAIQMSSALYAAWDGVTPATQSRDVVAELRRTGFRGAVVSSDLGALTLTTGQSVAEAAVEALRAGCDLLWVPGDQQDQASAWRGIVHAVRSGRVPVARVADALRQVGALQRRWTR
jgi:beta-N-acetylhexosaminidase